MARVVFLLILICSNGCSYDDALNVFGGGYSGGGTTRAEREADFNARVEALGEAN